MRSGNKNITTVWIVQPKSKLNLKSNTDPESISEAIALTKALPSAKIIGTTIVKLEKLKNIKERQKTIIEIIFNLEKYNT